MTQLSKPTADHNTTTNGPLKIGANPVLDINGIPVADLSNSEALALMLDQISDNVHCKISFLNAHNANVAARDAAFRKALGEFVLLPDGVGVDMGAKLLRGRKFKANLNGTDFIPSLLAEAKQPLKIALYGGRPGTADKAAKTFRTHNAAHNIRVLGHGFIDQAEQQQMLAEMQSWHPDVILVALGVPLQELWIADNLTADHCKLAFGVGALLDFAAGNVPRAPVWVRRLRAEWIYRLAHEPVRLAKRYLIGNPVFLARVMRSKLNQTIVGKSK